MMNHNTRRLLTYGLKYFKKQLIYVTLSIPPVILMIVRPFYIQYLIDNIVSKGREKLLLPFLFIFLMTIVLERLSSYWLNCYHIKLTNFVIKEEQVGLYNHIQMLKPEYFAFHSTGDLITKVLSDVQVAAPTMVVALPTMIFNLLALFAYILVLIVFSWKLTLITFCSIPLYYFSLNFFTKKLQKNAFKERNSYSKVNESIREKIEGIWTIKGLVKSGFFSRLFSDEVESWIKNRNFLYISNTAAQNVNLFITSVTPIIVLGYGGISVIKGALTLGTLIGFFSYMKWIYEPITRINEKLIELQTSEAPASRFFELLDTSEETDKGKFNFPEKYDLNFKNLTFAYNNKIVLKDVNFEIKEEEKVALVGISGSGKSTIANLLSRYYNPLEGDILINNLSLKEYKLDEIRKNILIVRQSDYLFNMTIKENIVLDDTFTKEEFLESVEISGVDKFISQLSQGYQTVVGERGSNLSEGQKQRICLARALIRKPKILILDEATSALDSKIEEEIFERMKKMQHTIIIISHRLSTIRKSDRILLLNNGRIIASSDHDTLLRNCPEYSKIIKTQLT